MSTQSLQYQVMAGVQTVIKALGLTDLDGGNVYVAMVPSKDNIAFPCVTLSLPPTPESVIFGSNMEDDWGYPVLVSLFYPADRNPLTADHPMLLWRELIMTAFHLRQKFAVAGARTVYFQAEPAPVIDLPIFKDLSLFANAFILRGIVRRQR